MGVLRIVVAAERERMPRCQPRCRGDGAVGRTSDVDDRGHAAQGSRAFPFSAEIRLPARTSPEGRAISLSSAGRTRLCTGALLSLPLGAPSCQRDRVGGIDWPFLGTEALTSGALSRRALYAGHQALYRNVYVPRGAEITAAVRAKAAWLWAGRRGVLGGVSAAAVLGALWIDSSLPAELYRIGDTTDGILIRRGKLNDDEVSVIEGMAVTTPARTAFDLGRMATLGRAVIHLDALARATRLERTDVRLLTERNRGARGIVQLRQVLDLFDAGAESPQETRTRLALVAAGLPKPQTQIVVRDRFAYPFARIDMGWEEWRVGVEYDGAHHWTDSRQRARDIDRWAELEALGWRIIRVSSEMLRYRRRVIVERACNALRAAGWSGEIRPDARFWLKAVS